jgi:FAD/FMN-containing dehydrogenase
MIDGAEPASPDPASSGIGAREANGEDAVEALRGFKGTLVRPEDPSYDDARKIWNGAIDRRPALIARCADEDDAATALAYALDAGLPVAIRGGGHNVAGSALCDAGVVIDFSARRGVQVDPIGRTARVEPGALWGHVDAATQAHGLATAAGVVSETGVAGLTVGGGFGWLSRRFGLTVDNLISATMVLADGRRIRVAEDENPDLFWAVRGGGGNFGIVTGFEFRLWDVGTEVFAGPLLYPADQVREVLRLYREFIADAPNELAVFASLRRSAFVDWVPPEVRGTDIVMLIPCYSGDLAEGETVVEPLRRAIAPAADLVSRRRYLDFQTFFNATVPSGDSYYWKSHYLPPLTDEAIEVMARLAWQKESAGSYSLLFHLGGAIDDRSDADSAASGRGATHAINISARWDEGPEHPDIGWCREYFAALEPHATGGVYVNFLHNDEGVARVRAAHGPRYERLALVKARFDPDNVFRSNQNIIPAQSPADSWWGAHGQPEEVS